MQTWFERGNIADFPRCVGVKLCNVADFSKLPVKMSWSSSFLKISSQLTGYYWRRRLFYADFALDWTRKHEEKDFEELVCQVNSCPWMCWFSAKLKIIGSFYFITFRANDLFWLFCDFCIDWCVIANSWKMWLQLIILRPYVVLKDLFCPKWFSSSNYAATMNVDSKSKSASETCQKLYPCKKSKWNRIHWTVFPYREYLWRRFVSEKVLIWGNLKFKKKNLWQKNRKKPKG